MTGFDAKASTYQQGFAGGLNLRGVNVDASHPGKVFYVADGDTAGSTPAYPNRKTPSDGNNGTFLAPYASLVKAVEQCVDKRGDIIVLLPGFVQAISTAVDIEAGNVTIMGQGSGDDRPQLTCGVADALDVEGDNVTIQNLYFNEGSAEAAAGAATVANVVGAGFKFLGNHVDLGAHDDITLTVAVGAHNLVVANNKWVVTADGTEACVDIEGIIDGAQFLDNQVIASVANLDEGFVDMEAIANTNTYFKGNVILGGGAQLVATADVGTGYGDVSRQPLEITTIAAEFIEGGEAALSAPVVNGNVDIHGVFFVIAAGMDTGDDLTVATETGITLAAATEVATATAPGDRIYAAAAGSTLTVDEVTTAETLLYNTPIAVRGAPNSETAIDVTATGTGEADGVYHIVWSNADGIATSEVEAS